ncbi:valine--pyruvate transaminase [Parathermosynechococcus lividus]
MNPALSQIGQQMSQLTGVRAIMKDIIETLRLNRGQDLINLSAGNPLILPEVEQLWRECTQELLASPEFGQVVCRYGTSQGYEPLIAAVVDDFNRRYGLNLSEQNVLVTPGSQAIYFFAANAFGGAAANGQAKKVVLPLSPEYTGYGGVSLMPHTVVAYRPRLEIFETEHAFKYRPDFQQLQIDDTTGCVIFSRPCNPTGNVLTDVEVRQIADLAVPYGVPVLIDAAYGPPYPSLNFTELVPVFGGNIVHCLSLSKAGLPGERVGIAIGDRDILSVLEAFQTNACIHASRYGQAIAALAIANGALADVSLNVIRPFYQRKFAVLEETLRTALPQDLPWFLHRGEGAIFAWLWLRNLPMTDWELYQHLKQAGVIVVPGSSFFPGLSEEWHHKQECLRISLTASDEEIALGMERLAATISQIYQDASTYSAGQQWQISEAGMRP